MAGSVARPRNAIYDALGYPIGNSRNQAVGRRSGDRRSALAPGFTERLVRRPGRLLAAHDSDLVLDR
jgi:hypothetical protein